MPCAARPTPNDRMQSPWKADGDDVCFAGWRDAGPGGPTEDPIDGFPTVAGECRTLIRAPACLWAGIRPRRGLPAGKAHLRHLRQLLAQVTEPGNPVADALNRRPSTSLNQAASELSWQGSSLLDGDVPTAIRRLKEKYTGELQVHGSCGLLQTLWQHDLIDEIAILQFPTVLGSGRRLPGPGTRPLGMRLLKSESTPSGIVCSTYARDGALRLGAIEPRSQPDRCSPRQSRPLVVDDDVDLAALGDRRARGRILPDDRAIGRVVVRGLADIAEHQAHLLQRAPRRAEATPA